MKPLPSSRGNLITLAILALLCAALVFLLLVPFVQPLTFAAVLAVAFEPLYERVARLIRRPAAAALAMTLLIVFLVLTPLAVLSVNLIQEARNLYQTLSQESLQQGGWPAYAAQLVEAPIQWAALKTGIAAPDIKAMLVERVQILAGLLGAWGASLLANLTSTLGDALLTVFFLFFLFLEGRPIRDGIYWWSPLSPQRTAELLGAIKDSIIANVHGMAAVSLAQGLLTSVGFLIAGLGAPVLAGVAAAVCALIPLAGTALVWGPAAIYLLFQGAWGKALFLALWGLIVVGMSDNLVRPWVLAGRTGMNTLMVFFSLMGGLHAFGYIGVFAGPVIFSTAIAVFRMLREEYAPAGAHPTSLEAGPAE